MRMDLNEDWSLDGRLPFHFKDSTSDGTDGTEFIQKIDIDDIIKQLKTKKDLEIK